jgi:hypothetical protein
VRRQPTALRVTPRRPGIQILHRPRTDGSIA